MKVEWLAVDVERGSRRRSLAHVLRDDQPDTTICGLPVPGQAWVASVGDILTCYRCLGVRHRRNGHRH